MAVNDINNSSQLTGLVRISQGKAGFSTTEIQQGTQKRAKTTGKQRSINFNSHTSANRRTDRQRNENMRIKRHRHTTFPAKPELKTERKNEKQKGYYVYC